MNIRKLVYAGVFTAIALAFSYVEFLIPFNFQIPGIKMGLSNIVIIISFYLFGPLFALVIGLCKVCLTALLFGTLFSFSFSLAGFCFSFLIMFVLLKTKRFSICGVSLAGGFFHNLGQIISASVLLKSDKLLYYFPILGIVGIITGILIGILSKIILGRIKHYDRFFEG